MSLEDEPLAGDLASLVMVSSDEEIGEAGDLSAFLVDSGERYKDDMSVLDDLLSGLALKRKQQQQKSVGNRIGAQVEPPSMSQQERLAQIRDTIQQGETRTTFKKLPMTSRLAQEIRY
jgi:hypothetical protein